MSPANKAYLDMKYTDADAARAELGRSDRGADGIRLGSGHAISAACPRLPCSASKRHCGRETIVTEDHIEFMAFPRLPAIAELGWSPWSTHNWDAFRVRLGAQGPRWTHHGHQLLPFPAGAVGHQPDGATGTSRTVRCTRVDRDGVV